MDLIARLCKLRVVALSCLIVCVFAAHGSKACAQGEVQRQHAADMQTFERGINTYHNNADDYPKPPQPKVSRDMSPNYVPVLSPPPRTPEAYVESAEQKKYITAMQHSSDGDRQASMTLAQCHYDGEGTPQNKAMAYDIWRRLENELPRAGFKAAQMVYRGDGVPQSITLGYYGIAHAAVRRDPEAIAWLAANGYPAVIDPNQYTDADPDLDRANDLLGGFGVTADPAAAVKIIEARSAEGYPRANYLLGIVYERGLSVPKDLKHAWSSYFLAADFGNGAASYRLGRAYWLGELGLPVDDAEGLRWLMLASTTGNADALYLRGDAFSKGLHGLAYDLDSALRLYLQSAKGGSASGAARLADAYYKGEGTAQDFALARQWAEKAEAGGQPLGKVVQAYLYQTGAGVTRDQPKAMALMQSAAEMGYPRAKEELAGGFGKDASATATPPKARALMEAEAAAYDLPSIRERAPEVFERLNANNPKLTAKEIAASDKELAKINAAFAMKDGNSEQRAFHKLDAHLILTLGKAYSHGDGVAIDRPRALTFFQVAMILNEPGADTELAWNAFLTARDHARAGLPTGDDFSKMRMTVGGVTPEHSSALSAYLQAVAAIGDKYPGNYVEIREQLKKAADGGITDAQVELANMALHGVGRPPDQAEAMRLFELAAKASPPDAHAMYVLGVANRKGLYGVAPNDAKGLEWLHAAAAAGEPKASRLLAEGK